MSFTFDEYFPFDPGHGASANATRWRKMAQLWAPDGVVTGVGQELNATLAGTVVTVNPGAVFVHGYYAELAAQQTFTVGASGTIVAQVNLALAAEIINLTYRAGIIDYGAGGYQQDANIWEIPLWLVQGGVLIDLRNRISPATGLRWWASGPGGAIPTGSTTDYVIGTARIPYVAQGFLQGSLLVTFTDMSQAQNADCTLVYQSGQADVRLSPTISPAIGAGGAAGQTLALPVSLTGIVPVTQGRKTFGWRVTAGPGPGIAVASMTVSLWTGGIPAAG